MLQIPVSPLPHLFSYIIYFSHRSSAQIKNLFCKSWWEHKKISHFGDPWWPKPCLNAQEPNVYPNQTHILPTVWCGSHKNTKIYHFRTLDLSLWVAFFYFAIEDFSYLNICWPPDPLNKRKNNLYCVLKPSEAYTTRIDKISA